MALSREQRSVLDEILSVGSTIRDPDKRRRYTRAAVQTGLVESNLRNLNYGDADSQGWRQERASLYANPTNVKASVRRFFNEAKSLDRGQPSWQLAADVQRPAAQYRGRYREVADQAAKLIGGQGGTRGGGKGGRTPTRLAFNDAAVQQATQLATQLSRPQTSITAPAAPAHSASAVLPQGASAAPPEMGGPTVAQRDSASLQDQLAQILQGSTVNAGQIGGAKLGGGKGRGGGAAKRGGKYDIAELFWQGPGGVNIKNNQPVKQGFVSGHTDHVHVAAGPKGVIALGKLAQKMGLTVRENPAFDKVDPVHAAGSYHYRNRAIDVSGSPDLMRKYAQRVSRMRGG